MRAGIKTREQIDSEPYGFAVEWIEWDSNFRESELRHQDIILGVNDYFYQKENREKDAPKAIGNYLETVFWSEQKAAENNTISLHIDRSGKRLSIQGKIQPPQQYSNANNKQTIGLNGPERLGKDGFPSPWASWYEQFIKHAERFLTDRLWIKSVFDSKRLLAEHLEWKPRVDYLKERYPCRFSETVDDDWEEVLKILNGNTYHDIDDKALEYRKIGEQRAHLAREAAIGAEQEYIKKHKDRTIASFPAIDPARGNRKDVAGKIVLLPEIGFDQFINDLGKSFAVIGSEKEGYYFIHLNSAEMDIFFRTLFYFKSQVAPDVKDQFRLIAEILDEPAILRVNGRSVTGLMVKVMAGIAGDNNTFIDTQLEVVNGRVKFSGEDLLSTFDHPPLESSANPQQVIEAMIYYIKMGDMNSWKKLFSTWQVFSEWGGRPYMNFMYWHTEENYQQAWEQSRKQILGDIYDARVLEVSSVKKVLNEEAELGIPNVEQVQVIIDHVGKIEGNYKSVSNLYVHRKWVLQRLNNGPWKITQLQAL